MHCISWVVELGPKGSGGMDAAAGERRYFEQWDVMVSMLLFRIRQSLDVSFSRVERQYSGAES